ncbi:hypothetical protein GOBAR_AA07832 [Gossypium barbadense]|uniref:Endonuclease/exonuclease/phosphatase domain-containing protein n=2 Tax=Gossypium TaxID=3633 RepID=A0A2P5YB14_GOSBA|nr:hypothetical protein GOBAR_AA07832 [Gossypium barbadense]TYH09047.1 hypothetical protein ES288_A07G064600v1 [Gossypium darwinii]
MKFLSWNCHGLGSPATIRELKQLIAANNPDIIFLCETKMNAVEFQKVQNRCRLQNGLVVNSEGRSGKLAMMCKDVVDVSIQTYSKHHIDSIVKIGNNRIWVTGFYGHHNPNDRSTSWGFLQRVGEVVKEEWVVGGDFNAMLNDAEKEGGRRIVRAHINEFRDFLDDLALVDIKPDRGWFTWVNNRNGDRLIKERLDRFIMTVPAMENYPFISSSVVRRIQSDHDVILFDLYRRQPMSYPNDNKIWFRFEECWAKDNESKRIIQNAWNTEEGNYNYKLERVRELLGP